MKKVIIYSTRICPYCIRAKNFFNKKDIDYTEIMIDQDPSLIKEMVEKSGRQSVPPGPEAGIVCCVMHGC